MQNFLKIKNFELLGARRVTTLGLRLLIIKWSLSKV